MLHFAIACATPAPGVGSVESAEAPPVAALPAVQSPAVPSQIGCYNPDVSRWCGRPPCATPPPRASAEYPLHGRCGAYELLSSPMDFTGTRFLFADGALIAVRHWTDVTSWCGGLFWTYGDTAAFDCVLDCTHPDSERSSGPHVSTDGGATWRVWPGGDVGPGARLDDLRQLPICADAR